MIAAVACLISLPLLVGAIYDTFNPRAVKVGNYVLPGYEQFKIERYENMTDRDMRFSDLRDDVKMREAYNKVVAEHTQAAITQSRRSLLMYAALFIASAGYLVVVWRDARADARLRAAAKGE